MRDLATDERHQYGDNNLSLIIDQIDVCHTFC